MTEVGGYTAEQRRAMTARATVCRCGRGLEAHPRRGVDGGQRIFACAFTGSGRFESRTLPGFYYDPDRGLTIDETFAPEPTL